MLTVVTIALAATVWCTDVRAETTLDFEDPNLEPPTRITTEFSDQGVVFPNSGYLDEDPAARSGTRVMRAGNPADEFHQGPFVISFTGGQSTVSLFAGARFAGQSGILRAFDVNGNLVDQDGPKTVAVNTFTTPFEVAAAIPTIRRLELEVGVASFESIDDLTFEGAQPEPPPPPPQVRIDEPDDGAQLDAPTLVVAGEATGDGLLPVARLVIERGLPPDSQAPGPFTSSLPLTGTGATRTFEQPLVSFLGPMQITVEAENPGGKGSDTVSATNLPQPIRDRHASEGGVDTFGTFQYADRAACTIAVYERGAIALEGTTTFVILGDIFTKWFAERDSGSSFSRLGCPTEDERDAPGDARAQNFREGRIYAGLPTGSHFVPAVFTEAIDRLGGEGANGVPLADPTDSIGAMRTWLFQRFTRPDRPQLLPSTLEIRGTPPALWVERQAGDMGTIFNDIPITAASPSIWLRFPCADNLGPCDISIPDPQCPNGDADRCPIDDAGDRFCQGTVYPLGPKEWEPVEGDHVLTEMIGIVRTHHLAGKDNPLTHRCRAAGPVDLWPSDINVSVRPLPPFHHLFADNRVNVEIEYEHCWFAFGFAAGMEPIVGDLVFTAGRWIIDCGHADPYRSEIHPPAVLASMRTVTRDGRPATRADIWINGTYNGDQVDIEIYPPPRPSPDAILNLVKPPDSQGAVDIDVEGDLKLMSARARFSASPRQVPIEDSGEMRLEGGRVYHGRWHVFWTDG